MARSYANTKDGIRRLNTKIYDANGHFSVQLYSTVVYDETKDKLVLDNGGWSTPTTTSRMNQALDHRGIKGGVTIKDRQMYFYCESLGSMKFIDGKIIVCLVDGQVA